MGIFNKSKKKDIQGEDLQEKDIQSEALQEPEVIVESQSPVCDIYAFVEKSSTCYYLYLWVHPSSDNPQIRACWIANRKRSPKELDMEAMEKGNAPMMQEAYVAHNQEGIELDDKSLSIVWFAEGDGAAVMSGEELLCVVPGWSDNRFPGYSIYAKGTGPYAWEMTNALNTLMQRVNDSRKKWEYFETDFWGTVQSEHMTALENFFGEYEKYYAIDGGKFPPKALVTGKKGGVVYGITAGVSLIPMPIAEQYFQDDVCDNRRIELGFAVCEQHKQLCEMMYSVMSSLAAYPWKEITFFAHGHTIPFQNIKGYSALLFVNPKLIGAEKPDYKPFMGDEINLLWIVPITEEEYAIATETNSEKLISGAADLKRVHIFDGTRKF